MSGSEKPSKSMAAEAAVALPAGGKLPRVRLKAREEDRLLAGHLWVFSNEISSVEGEAGAGSLAEVFSAGGRFLGCGFYHPRSLIAVRLLSRGPLSEGALDELFRQRLGQALARRESLFPGESAYRWCFGESDGLPGLVIDRFGGVLVIEALCAGIDARLDRLAAALGALAPVSAIYLRNSHRMRALEGLSMEDRVLLGSAPEEVEIVHDGIRFKVALGRGQKTGYYFDQRENRSFIRRYARGRRVLDLYSYSGGFALNAAKFGALEVLGVESSGEAVRLARENAVLNGVDAKIRWVEGDSLEFLRGLKEGSADFKPDFIMMDPPNLCPSKKDLGRALRAYAAMNARALEALAEGGLLATSSCSHHVSRELFVDMLRAAQAKAGRPTRIEALRTQSPDHPILLAMPETEYLHFALLAVV